MNTLTERLADDDVDEILRLADADWQDLKLSPASWTSASHASSTSSSVAHVDIPASLLQAEVHSQIATYDERYRRAQAASGQSTNAGAQVEAYGQRDATGVEAVHDAMPSEAETFDRLIKMAVEHTFACGEEDATISVLDFGCGDGRYLPLYVRTAQAIRALDSRVRLRVVAYDISVGAIESFRHRALKVGLSPANELLSAGYAGDVLLGDGFSITLLLGDGDAGVDEVAQLFRHERRRFDLVVVGWGTLSSIPNLPNISQQSLLRLFTHISVAIMNVVSSTNNHVSFQREFRARRKAYEAATDDKLRSWLQHKIGLATFPGSFYYPLDTGKRQFYSAVTAGEEVARLEASGFSDVRLEVCNIVNFFDISTKPRAARLDAEMRRLLAAGDVWRAHLVLCHGVAKISGRPFAAVWSGSCMFDGSSELACVGQVARYFISSGVASVAANGS